MASVYTVSVAREVPRNGRIRREDSWHRGTGYILRLKGVAAARESVIVLERPKHLPQLRLR